MSWLSTLLSIGKRAVKGVEVVKPPLIKPMPIADDQYYKQEYKKKYIFCHHTAGGSAASSFAWWAKDPKRIATPYLIDRDGTIYEVYSPSYWAYHLGVKGNPTIEKESIGIEICNYGQLTKKVNGDLVTYTGAKIEPEKVAKCDFRGFQYWESYTPQQIVALKSLLPYLMERFGIKPQANIKNFWEYKNPSTLESGIYSHTTVRKDKFDIFPQKELIEAVYSLTETP